LSCAIETVEGLGILLFVGFQTDHDGGLITFCISDGFVVTIDLQSWISIDPTIVGVLFVYIIGTCSSSGDENLFSFGIVLGIFETLDVTLVIG
jgi:hypothetical protein